MAAPNFMNLTFEQYCPACGQPAAIRYEPTGDQIEISCGCTAVVIAGWFHRTKSELLDLEWYGQRFPELSPF